MKLQLLEKGFDSSDGIYGMCLKWFGTKRTSGICFGLSSAELALFWAEMEFLVYLGV